MLVAPGDSRQGTAGAKRSGRDHDVGVSAKQKHIKKKKKIHLKLKCGRLWIMTRSTCILKGQFKVTDTKSRVLLNVSFQIHQQAGLLQEVQFLRLQLWRRLPSRLWTIVLPFPAVVEQQQLRAVQLLVQVTTVQRSSVVLKMSESSS